MTAFQALIATRGQWQRTPLGQVACPVCGTAIDWPDYVRARHLTRHLRGGWVPQQLVPLRAAPSALHGAGVDRGRIMG